MAGRKPRSDSIAGQKEAAKNASLKIEKPAGISFDHPEEEIIWQQFTAARSADNWREFDLLVLAKMVVLEFEIRRHFKTYRKTGPIIQNKRGTMIENPILRSIDTLQRQQLAMIRSLSLGVHSDHARDMNRTGQIAGQSDAAIDAADIEKIKKGKVLSLIKI